MTLVEILVTLLIAALILASADAMFAFMRNIRETTALNKAGGDIKYILEQARSQTIASKDQKAYGVHFESGKIVLFVAPTYSATASTNETTVVDPYATIYSIVIAGGGSDVVFERLTGETSNTGTVSARLVSATSRTVTATISKTGYVTLSSP